MTPIRLIRSAIALVAAAFAFSPQVGAADHYDGNLYVTSVAQAPNGGLWIQVNDTVISGRTIVSGGAPVFGRQLIIILLRL